MALAVTTDERGTVSYCHRCHCTEIVDWRLLSAAAIPSRQYRPWPGRAAHIWRSSAEASTPAQAVNPIDWAKISLAEARSFAPSAFAINAAEPWLKPLPIAKRRKKTGNESDNAARASVLSSPAQYVSTKLNIVLKNIPTLAGSAIFQVSSGMGSLVSEWGRFIQIGNSKQNEVGHL